MLSKGRDLLYELTEVHAELLPANVFSVLVILELFEGQGSNFCKALDRFDSCFDGHDELGQENLDELSVKNIIHWDPRKIRL